MSKTLVCGVLSIGIAICYLVFPLSDNASYERAMDELRYYCTDLGYDCSRFVEVQLVDSSGSRRVYEWKDMLDAGKVVQVRVPRSRIGDISFGVFGEDVTLGTYEASSLPELHPD